MHGSVETEWPGILCNPYAAKHCHLANAMYDELKNLFLCMVL